MDTSHRTRKSHLYGFGICRKIHNGICNLRFDDTNPTTEDVEYVNSIQKISNGLALNGPNVYTTLPDYFQQLWDLAVKTNKRWKAYIDDNQLKKLPNKGNHYPGIERVHTITVPLEIWFYLKK